MIKMGHNIDLSFFGICNLKCKKCKEIIDLSEIDIDCDLNTHNPFYFDLNIQCQECHENTEFNFEIKPRRR